MPICVNVGVVDTIKRQVSYDRAPECGHPVWQTFPAYLCSFSFRSVSLYSSVDVCPSTDPLGSNQACFRRHATGCRS